MKNNAMDSQEWDVMDISETGRWIWSGSGVMDMVDDDGYSTDDNGCGCRGQRQINDEWDGCG